MNKEQAASLTKGLTAVDRMVLVNRETKQVEIHEQTGFGESKISKSFPLMDNTKEGWREHNISVLRTIHELTDGGRGRDVDSTVLTGWKALGLADNSTKTSREGYAL